MATIEERVGKTGKTYTARVRYKGKHFTETFKSKTKAKKWARDKEKEIDDGTEPTNESTKRTVNDLIEIYDDEKLDKEHNDYKKIKNQLNEWCKKIGHIKLSKITPATICKYRRQIRLVPTRNGDTRSPATVNRYMSALSGAFTYAVEELHWLKVHVVRQVKKLPENPPPVRFLDKEKELPRLMEACARSANTRLLPLFMTAICLGLRAGALLWLHIGEINLDKRTIRIPPERSKNGRAFTLGITDLLYPHMKYLVDNCHPESGLLFPHPNDPLRRMCYRNDWEEALALAEIENYRFHDNRHTCGSYLAMAGYGLAEIAELLNHKTLEMAKRYSHLADEYREKLAEKMHDEFVADAVTLISEIPGINHPAVAPSRSESSSNGSNTSKPGGKPVLRLVK